MHLVTLIRTMNKTIISLRPCTLVQGLANSYNEKKKK